MAHKLFELLFEQRKYKGNELGTRTIYSRASKSSWDYLMNFHSKIDKSIVKIVGFGVKEK